MDGQGWSRRYPPLLTLAIAVLVAAFVLPSSLNLPQSNPSTVLEYAPVPPDDESNDDTGNVASLGLGSTTTLGDEVAAAPPPLPTPAIGTGLYDKRAQLSCVAGRQTEDPMAPPCVAYWDPEADNFGETWLGVTRDTITVLLYVDQGCPNSECTRQAGESQPDKLYEDLDGPAKPPCPQTFPAGNPGAENCDYIWTRIARGHNAYFNARYQTYGRHVKYIVYYAPDPSGAPGRRRQAQDNINRVKPFAVIDYATYQGYNADYDQAIAARGAMVVQSRAPLAAEQYRTVSPNSWGFYPDVEHWADLFSTYVCTRIKDHPVTQSGAGGVGSFNGDPRKYGLWYTTDSGEPGLARFTNLVKAQIRACGITSFEEATFPDSGFLVGGANGGAAADAVVKFRSAGVNTIMYLGGSEGQLSAAAAEAKYYPEVVLAGDIENDNNQFGRNQQQDFWRNVRGVSFLIRVDNPTESIGFKAYREANPNATAAEARFALEMYRDHYMIFQAIQAAGPRLTPASVEAGFQAIPKRRASENPYQGAFYFDTDDYTALKDGMEVWWDPAGLSPDGNLPGCYRMTDGGTRFLSGTWPAQDRAFENPNGSAPCTGYEGRFQLRL